MTTVPSSPEVRAIQALTDAETSLRAMSVATQGVSDGVDTAADRLDTAVDALKTLVNSVEATRDALKTVSASNAIVVANIDAAANALVRATTALEEIREDRLRSND